jgi:hypothetical protein
LEAEGPLLLGRDGPLLLGSDGFDGPDGSETFDPLTFAILVLVLSLSNFALPASAETTKNDPEPIVTASMVVKSKRVVVLVILVFLRSVWP